MKTYTPHFHLHPVVGAVETLRINVKLSTQSQIWFTSYGHSTPDEVPTDDAEEDHQRDGRARHCVRRPARLLPDDMQW